jgi:AcrR family transcriptional regulator
MLASSTLLAKFTLFLDVGGTSGYSGYMSYHHGNLRQALVNLAMEELERIGLEDLSLRALAESLGVSKAAPYRHFPTKRDLLVAMAAEGYQQFADMLEAEEERMDDLGPQERIRRLYRLYGEFATGQPERYRLMFSRLGNSLHSERCRINAGRAFSMLVRQVSNLHPGLSDTRAAVLSLFASLHGWVMILLDDLIPPQLGVSGENWLDYALSPDPDGPRSPH